MTGRRDPRWCALLKGAQSGPERPRTDERSPTPAEVDRADFDPSYDPGAPIVCEICGAHMRYTAACKIECHVCGYRRDCSDP